MADRDTVPELSSLPVRVRSCRSLLDRQPRALVIRAVVWAAFPRRPQETLQPFSTQPSFWESRGCPIGHPHTHVPTCTLNLESVIGLFCV